MGLTIQEKLLGKLWIKVTKKTADDRNSLCGQAVIKDPDGKEADYFYIPAHEADVLPFTLPNYEFDGDNYITDKEYKALKEEIKNRQPKPTEETAPVIAPDYLDRLLDERNALRKTIAETVTASISANKTDISPLQPETETEDLFCKHPGCGFEGKNANGLRMHKQKHVNELVTV